MSAEALIAALALAPHPEGGWYRETWRAEAAPGERASATAILFLLEAGQSSHWHKVDAAELWLFHTGSPLRLLTAPDAAGPVTETRLGGDVLGGETPQLVIEPHHWQAGAGRSSPASSRRASISRVSSWPRLAGRPRGFDSPPRLCFSPGP